MPPSRPVLYLAGPEVFRPDAVAEGARLKALCTARGLEGVYPLDGPLDADASAIRQRCIDAIERASAVLANISPFRGPHMDPGTAFELGYAQARGRPLFLWSVDARPLRDRIPAVGAGLRDAAGDLIEDFGLSENLMITPPGAVVHTAPEAAIAAAAACLLGRSR
ncbi:MAG TPA: nucleoside 2-deoxyribosyltransferase [Xanthobacteraceae bacterium]|nr:nucleoside 2-deoxyribosyltransferase [Xanthobacteraceae bacterium]